MAKIKATTEMLFNRNFKIFIGIDCGVNTGVAVWHRGDRKLSFVGSMTILEAIDFIKDLIIANPVPVKVRVEDARLRKWIPQQKNETAERGRREGAGSVKRDASIWEEFLTSKAIPYEMVAPKNNRTKMQADYFQKLTGWQQSTNSHGRDAAALVFGL